MDWQDIVFVFFHEQTSRVATLRLRKERRQRVKKQQRVNSRF